MMKRNFLKALSGLLILSLLGATACKDQKKEKAGTDFDINSIPKKASAGEIPGGYLPCSVEKWDMSLCYPQEAEADYSKKSGLTITWEDGREIRILRRDGDPEAPEDVFGEIASDLEKDYKKIKGGDIDTTKIGKRKLYYQPFSSKEAGVDVYLEIYDEFTMVYMAVAEENGDLEAVLNTVLTSIVWDAGAYDEISVEPPSSDPGPSPATTRMEGNCNLAITVPSDEMTPVDCPAGVYVSYPGYNIGALYLNSDPIGACVYQAEELLQEFMIYDGMFASLMLVDSAQVTTYYDSSFYGTPEIDAEFTFTANGQSGSGYARMINGTDIGCYLVFYTMLDGEDDAKLTACKTAIETFEVLGAPTATRYIAYDTPMGIKIAMPDYMVVENDTVNVQTVITNGDPNNQALIVEEQNLNDDLQAYIDLTTSYFDLNYSNHTHSGAISYDKSRYQSMMVTGSAQDPSGVTFYYGYAVIILENSTPYACIYITDDPDTSKMDEVIDDFLWSAYLIP